MYTRRLGPSTFINWMSSSTSLNESWILNVTSRDPRALRVKNIYQRRWPVTPVDTIAENTLSKLSIQLQHSLLFLITTLH